VQGVLVQQVTEDEGHIARVLPEDLGAQPGRVVDRPCFHHQFAQRLQAALAENAGGALCAGGEDADRPPLLVAKWGCRRT
jgi:hypothetical protein